MVQIRHRCAVLGSPIAHSLSPLLHNAAYRALGLNDWCYQKMEVKSVNLPDFLETLDPSWSGLSLTMPLKKTIQDYGLPVDQWSADLAVSNTAILDWSEHKSRPAMHLYNTDVDGIILAFQHVWSNFGNQPKAMIAEEAVRGEGHHALILGNGNTALSALAALVGVSGSPGMFDEWGRGGSRPKDHIAIAARHPYSNPDILAFAREHQTTVSFESLPLQNPRILAAIDRASLVISTLPSHAADSLADGLAESGLSVSGSLLDVAYDPNPSALSSVWLEAGGQRIGGEEMLLYQALLQVLLMTAPYADWTESCQERNGVGMNSPVQPRWRVRHGKLVFSFPAVSDKLLNQLENAMRSALREVM